MNRKIYIAFMAGIVALFLLTAYSGVNTDYAGGGAPAGYTGSPGDGQNCKTGCHNGSVSTVSGWITSDIPAAGYTAGTTYSITATVTGSGNHGFEISPQNPSGTLLGTLIAGAGQTLKGGGKYVTHSNSANGNPQSWTFQWVAPVAGTGIVTFYGAFTITKSQTRLSTLVVNELVPFIVNATATPGSICAGGTSQLNADASGGSGNYSYSWTSIPAGFTSNIKNPVVTPAVTTNYISNVNDGALTVTDTVEVSVSPIPVVNAGNDTIYCETITVIPSNATATNYTSILWTTSGTGTFSSTGSLNTLYYPTTADKAAGFVNLYLTVTPISPCTSTVSDARHIQLDPCNGIQEGDAAKITILPNPSNGLFTITSSSNKNQEVKITIYDMNERQKYFDTMFTGVGNLNKNIDLRPCAKGIYILKLEVDGKPVLRKLVIQ
jgi:hypothetical protein